MVDKQVIAIRALEEGDDRIFSVAVAGPAALVVAKAHKIAGRRDEGRGRLNDKDALDVYRLMRSVEPRVFGSGFELLARSRLAASSTEWAVREFGELFGETQSLGVEMVVRATEGLIPEAEVRAACPILAREILAAAGLQRGRR